MIKKDEQKALPTEEMLPILFGYQGYQENLENIVEVKLYKEGQNLNLILCYLI